MGLIEFFNKMIDDGVIQEQDRILSDTENVHKMAVKVFSFGSMFNKEKREWTCRGCGELVKKGSGLKLAQEKIYSMRHLDNCPVAETVDWLKVNYRKVER